MLCKEERQQGQAYPTPDPVLSPASPSYAVARDNMAQGYLYITGGVDELNNHLNKVERYSPTNNKWCVLFVAASDCAIFTHFLAAPLLISQL